jgi:hypothetical protein
VLLPRSADLTFVPPDKVEGVRQVSRAHPVILRQLDLRLQPELRLSIRVMDMDVWSRLLTREKVEAVATMAKNRRAHPAMLHRQDCVPETHAGLTPGVSRGGARQTL